MKYINTKTGVIIETNSKLKGSWLPYEEKEKVKESVEESVEEVMEEEVDLSKMTKNELVEFAKEHEIEINARDTKEVIIDTIARMFE